MAQFYQDPNPTSDPDYSRVSKEPDRIQADTSLGGLFSGIGDVAGKALPAAENLFKERIKDDAHKLIDPIMDQHGAALSGTAVQQIAGTGAKGRVRALQMKGGAGADEVAGGAAGDDLTTPALAFTPQNPTPDITAGGIFPDPSAKPLPEQAEAAITELERMKKAYNAGSLSDSYWLSQVLSVTRQLRNQYPGFRDEVDTAISGITGVQPANAIRSSLMRDIQYNQAAQLAAASEEQKFRDKHIAEGAAIGMGDHTPYTDFRAGVSNFLGRQAFLHAKELEAKASSPEAEALLTDSMAQIVQNASLQQRNLAQGGQSLEQFRAKAVQMSLNGGGKPGELDQLVFQMQQRRNDLSAQMDAVGYKPIPGRTDGHSQVTLVADGATKFAAIKQAQLQKWDDQIALVKSKNFSALEQVTDANKYTGQVDVQNFLRNFPQARLGAAISNAFPGNPMMTNRFMEQSSILPDFAKALKTYVGNSLLNGSTYSPAPSPSAVVKAYGPDLQDNGEVYKQTVKQYDMLTSPNNKNIPNAAHVAKQFFKDQEFMAPLDIDAQLKVFMVMGSPSKTAFIQKLAEEDPELKTLHANWMKKQAGILWRQNSADLQDLITTKGGPDITFNPQTVNFIYTPKPRTQTSSDTGAAGVLYGTSENERKNVQQKVDSINNVITLMKPVVGNDGPSILGALGIDLNAPKEDTLTEKIVKAVGDKWKNRNEASERDDVRSGRTRVQTPARGPNLEPEQTRGVVQGNLSDSPLLGINTEDIPEGMSARDFIRAHQAASKKPAAPSGARASPAGMSPDPDHPGGWIPE